MYGFKFFETSIYQTKEIENVTHIKSIFKKLVSDIINLNRYGDDAKDSFTLGQGKHSSSKVNENQSKGCSC
jgi:hypothetical protein